jgi:hypothetical protein
MLPRPSGTRLALCQSLCGPLWNRIGTVPFALRSPRSPSRRVPIALRTPPEPDWHCANRFADPSGTGLALCQSLCGASGARVGGCQSLLDLFATRVGAHRSRGKAPSYDLMTAQYRRAGVRGAGGQGAIARRSLPSPNWQERSPVAELSRRERHAPTRASQVSGSDRHDRDAVAEPRPALPSSAPAPPTARPCRPARARTRRG